MNDSCENVFCSRHGDRKGPVQNGEATTCISTRSLLIVPVPPHAPPTQPVTYEGAAFWPLSNAVLGAGAGVRGASAGTS